MWIRINDVLCRTDNFSKFYIEMHHGEYSFIGKEYDGQITIFVNYKSYYTAKEVLNDLYAALERGDRVFTMPNQMY